MPGNDINTALRQFEAAEANLQKLERLWGEIEKMIPDGLVFGNDPKYDDRVRSYEDVLAALPKLDGWKPVAVPADLNTIGQMRLDAKEVGDISAEISVEDEVYAPVKQLAEYKHRLNKVRRRLIRNAMGELLADVDGTIASLEKNIPENALTNEDVTDPKWDSLKEQVQAIETLLGSGLPRPSRWSDLRRHLAFGVIQDLQDIIRMDWPAVKSGLTKGLYADDEPIPVEVDDLGALATTQPTGPVAVKLNWQSLDDEAFERLIFALISRTPGYENPAWLTHTNAADRGRDLSVVRVIADPLGGTTRHRVIIQCKHWLNRSVAPTDIALLREQMALWGPPRVDVLIISTTGRFTTDAIQAIEKHNESDRALRIEMWPESHLEKLLAERPALIAEFRLR